MRIEYGYPTLEVIDNTTVENESATIEILSFYDAYICKLCLRPFFHSESSKIIIQIDEELKGQIHTELMKGAVALRLVRQSLSLICFLSYGKMTIQRLTLHRYFTDCRSSDEFLKQFIHYALYNISSDLIVQR